ncbi:glycosyltransferase [Dyella sp. C9]|uniref:glycosyltransferase n=1 Tax=Dyella sp. C9 TaxID=2202154 RepID=UPI0018E501A9|nr:glycosyltransferase [Dyella sp. C9]
MRSSSVGIFRLQLFKPSETFITSQADNLSRYEPTYIGRALFGGALGRKTLVPESARSKLARAGQLVRTVGLRDMSEYVSALRAEAPDLIHAHFGIDGVYAAPLAKRLGIPLVTTLHGFDVTRSDTDLLRSGRPALINGVLCRRQLQRQGSLFICVSDFIKRAAVQRGYPEHKLRVHYIGIDTHALQPRYGTGEDGLIVHVARLVEKKGTRYLLRALAKLVPMHPMVRLVILGDGPLRASLEAEALRLGVADRVQFLGMRPNAEVLQWDARAAVKAVPSVTGVDGDREGLPTVITETSALGVPVVAFDSGGIGEAIEHGDTGFLSPETDVDGLAHHLSLLLSDAELRGKMGRAARLRVEGLFDIRKQTSELEHLYDEARDLAKQ